MEALKWERIDIGTHLTDEMTSFHVDTRNFMCMYTIDPLEKYDGDDDRYYNKFNDLYDLINGDEDIDEKYLIDKNDVLSFVFTIREIRNLNDAIIVRFDEKGCDWWVKYLRFYPYKGRYVVTNDCLPIEWRKLTSKSFIGING